MSSDFEWRIGDELPERSQEGAPVYAQRWRWWLTLGLVLVLIGGGIYGWWRYRQRTLLLAEDQVRDVARLELQALVEGDCELYLSLQDDTDLRWKEAQETYADVGPLPVFVRERATAVDASIDNSRIVGDSARVGIRYVATLPSGERASFHAVRFYRYTSDGRWLHTEADPTYGGEPVNLISEEVEFTVLGRDADMMETLLPALRDTVNQFCELASCRRSLPLTLDLTGTLDEDAISADGALPAPFLVGAPENETALALWSTGLQTFALDLLIAREIGAPSIDVEGGEILRDRLRSWFLGKLGLGEFASPDVELLRDALAEGKWVALERLWRLPPGDARQALAEAEIDLLLAFVEGEYGSSAVASLPQALRTDGYGGAALAQVVDLPFRTFKRRYLTYAHEIAAEQTDELAAFDSYDLLLSCWKTLESIDSRVTWGVRLGEKGLTLLSAESELDAATPIAWSSNGKQLLLWQDTEEDAGFYVLKIGHAEARPLSLAHENEEPSNGISVSEVGWSPDGRYLAYGTSGASGVDGVVDLKTGEKTWLDGTLVAWSPTNSRLIYGQPVPWHWTPEIRVQTFWLWNQESRRAHRLARGYGVAWSSDGMDVAYVSSEPALRMFNVVTEGTETVLNKRSLQQALDFSPSLSPTSGQPFKLAWSPDGEWIAVGATRVRDDGAEEGLTLLVSPESHRILGRQPGGFHHITWSPDGRRVTSITLDRGRLRSVVTGLDGEVLFTEQDRRVLWSPDGRYLASVGIQASDRRLRILDPHGTERGVFDLHDSGWCGSLMWNPRGPLHESDEG